MMRSNLKYLYRAVYKDGTMYDQNLDDKSVLTPGKSCYNDLNLAEIHYFTLSDGLHCYTIDLTDGGISINGATKVYLTDKVMEDYRLIHFRRVTLSITNDTREYTTNFVLGFSGKTAEGQVETYTITIK